MGSKIPWGMLFAVVVIIAGAVYIGKQKNV